MERYDVKCPECGTLNRNLYLEETEGWMECECCGNTSRIAYRKPRMLGVLDSAMTLGYFPAERAAV